MSEKLIHRLFVGDVHARPEELADCLALKKLILETVVAQTAIEEVWFLGDMHHSHAWIHLDVVEYWQKFVRELLDLGKKVIMIAGNHDLAPSGNSSLLTMPREVQRYQSAVSSHALNMTIVPYGRNPTDFGAATKTMIAHHTFNGVKFENGFYAKDGYEPDDVHPDIKLIISGHIHEPQKFGRVWYLGSPRWLTISDAGSDRFIYYLVFDKNGNLKGEATVPTDTHCSRIERLDDTQEEPVAHELLDPRHRYYFDIKGPKWWVTERADLLQKYGKVRCFFDQATEVKVSEKVGIAKAYKLYLDGFKPPNGTEKEILEELSRNRELGYE